MELQGRKMKILQAIIRNYLETGEPVGSRTISRYTDLHLSSATIRNEMADLEEMGLITQPHTSAGRIPTDAGYRIYVDDMLKGERTKVQDLTNVLLKKQDDLDHLLQQVAKVLAANTDYASMISAPAVHKNKIRFIQLSQIDRTHIVAVIVLEGNLIRNTMIEVDDNLGSKTLLRLNVLLNSYLCGVAVDEINLGTIAFIKKQAGIHSEIISHVIDSAAEAIVPEDKPKIFTSGATNMFKYPELKGEPATKLITDFEEKKGLSNIVSETIRNSAKEGIQVYIGSEMPQMNMQDCSVVTATYDLGDGMKGTVGVIGPKRMDYSKVFSVMEQIMTQLDTLYKK